MKDRLRTPVRVSDDRQRKAVTEGRAWYAANDDSRHMLLKDEIVNESCLTDDLLAKHMREAPSAIPITYRMPFGELQTIWQLCEHRPTVGTFGEDDAADAAHMAALADDRVARDHRANHHLTDLAIRREQPHTTIRTKASAPSHKFVR